MKQLKTSIYVLATFALAAGVTEIFFANDTLANLSRFRAMTPFVYYDLVGNDSL